MVWDSLVYMTHEKIGNKWLLAVRRPHEIKRNRRNLYLKVRQKMDLTARDIAALVGISEQSWYYREREKEVYRLGELCALRELSGMSWDELGALIESCA